MRLLHTSDWHIGRSLHGTDLLAEQEAGRSEVRHMMQRFFGNSRERLLLSLLGDDEVTPEELERLKGAIAAAADATRLRVALVGVDFVVNLGAASPR